ncbi:motility associated factor glycosyltransferase family protein [Paenibacillus cymbidii]|uniref:motility associated factor glycosyltransferase family protein n=1 Tax=Paenibacillus cymbidii TaxID=1639034 RepID=UPI001436A96D|nr:6-hydroxymethylpterin diphosphokinase MptE-like protein [Paenibacillus cymbidii]
MENQLTGYTITEQLSDSGEKVYVYTEPDGKTVPLNSLYSPAREAQRFLKPYLDKKKFFALVGTGNGALLKEWLRMESAFVYLYVIEPFQELEFDDELKALLAANKKVAFEYLRDLSTSTMKFRSMIEKFGGVEFEVILHPHYDKTQTQYLKDTIARLSESSKMSIINQNTQKKFRKDWIVEPLLNLEYTAGLTLISELKGKFAGQKAVLAAAGPSLKENIETVKRLQQSAYIFAAGSALNGLLNNGITPDYAVSLDSSIINYESHFKDTGFQGPLIYQPILNSNILREHQGTAIAVGCFVDDVTKLAIPDLPIFPSAPSVAIFTLQVIQYLGFETVYLIGQDLALVGGKYYADGVHQTDTSGKQKISLQVESNSGEMVGTTYGLNTFLQTFVGMVRQIDKAKMQLYNLSKHGAKIEGVPYLPVEELPELPPREEQHIVLKPKLASAEGIKHIHEIVDEFKRLSELMKRTNKRLSYIKERVVSFDDLKKTLRALKRVRKNPLLENVFLAQFSFTVQKMNNIFEYQLDNAVHSNEDRVTMTSEIKKLFLEVEKFLGDVLSDSRLECFLKEDEAG